MVNIIDHALRLAHAGYSVVPIDHATKKPFDGLRWGQYQKRIATDSELRAMFTPDVQSLAVLCGKVSGGLTIIDIDEPRLRDPLLDAGETFIARMPEWKTGGGGTQFAFRSDYALGNQKLAFVPDDNDDTGRRIAIETRGEGGYAVIPPSLHPSGNRYEARHLDLLATPFYPADVAEMLLGYARDLCEAPLTRKQLQRLNEPAPPPRPKAERASDAPDIIGAFNARYTPDSFLRLNGYTILAGDKFRRAGKSSGGDSGLIRDCRDGVRRSFHFSSNDELHSDRHAGLCDSHDAFDLFVHFDHGGNVTRAVPAAADMLGIRSKAMKDAEVDDAVEAAFRAGDPDARKFAELFISPLDVAKTIDPSPLTFMHRTLLKLGAFPSQATRIVSRSAPAAELEHSQ